VGKRKEAKGDDAAKSLAEAPLKGLGTASRILLASAGIDSPRKLARLGAIESFRRVKAMHPKRVSLNLLWALEGALTGRDWREVARYERGRLLIELEATIDPSADPTGDQAADQSR
jgi:DNA transformation protein and related proteins